MATYIRLTDYKSSDEKEQEFFNPENRYEAKQEDFEKITGSPIAYWVSQVMKSLFEEDKLFLFADAKVGLQTGDNELFLRYWHEVKSNNISFKSESLLNEIWLPYNKGGSIRKWYGNNEYIINWSNNGNLIRNHKSAVIRNERFYLKSGYSWSSLTSGMFNARYTSGGFLFDTKGPTIFIKENINLLGFVNSKVSNYILKIISPTLDYNPGPISKLPIVLPKSADVKQQIEVLTQQNIDISKEEWDSRETSWDFAQNEILRILNDEFLVLNEKKPTIETVYNRYCEYWADKHKTLHQNEEELNRLFIDIYELQDELTSDVELKDITILKNETKIIKVNGEAREGDLGRDGALVFQADEIMKQFISYSVGVMFGRYSLDSDGLQIANLGSETQVVQMTDETKVSFSIDDDNVIPVLEDDYFQDDIASRFVQFVKATFGEEDLSENVRFIESSLGTTLRKYFVKGFYEDHVKRYKKRPIYWMIASPKKGFMSLIYMHRYEADTFARVRNSYLTEYITKLEAHKVTLTLTTTSETASDADKKQADKQIKQIDAKLKELIAFDRDKMMRTSQNPIMIDLDDGVKVNYCRFKDILFPITGLCK